MAGLAYAVEGKTKRRGEEMSPGTTALYEADLKAAAGLSLAFRFGGIALIVRPILPHQPVGCFLLSKSLGVLVCVECERVCRARVVRFPADSAARHDLHGRYFYVVISKVVDDLLYQAKRAVRFGVEDAPRNLVSFFFGRFFHSVSSLAAAIDSVGNCDLPRLTKWRPAGGAA